MQRDSTEPFRDQRIEQSSRQLSIAVLQCLLLLLLASSATMLRCARADDTYRVIHAYPHDAQAFTQGLVYLSGSNAGRLYESTGLPGRSSLRLDELVSGRVLQQHDVVAPLFAEGLTDWGSTLVQLTWQAHTGFVYDRASFKLLRTFHYAGEGWGLTHDNHSLILSDGTSSLRFLNPRSFVVERTLAIRDHGRAVDQLNELEYVHGEVYANVWMSNRIARISPKTGDVLGWIDLTGLLPLIEETSPDAVLNGIAYDRTHHRLFVTGKLWPRLFEIKLVPGK